MAVNQANANKINQFNQKNQQKQQQANQAQNPGGPAPKLVAAKHMSASDIALIQKSQTPGQVLTQDEQIRLKALETKENLRIAAEQKAAQDKLAREQLEKDAKLHQQALLTAQRGLENAGAPLAPAANWFANVPTPGGLATIIALIIIFVIAIVPADANGNTRLKLVWLTLTGKTHLAYQDTQVYGGGAGGASGDFGSGTNNQNPNTSVSPIKPTTSTQTTRPSNNTFAQNVPIELPPNVDLFGNLGF